MISRPVPTEQPEPTSPAEAKMPWKKNWKWIMSYIIQYFSVFFLGTSIILVVVFDMFVFPMGFDWWVCTYLECFCFWECVGVFVLSDNDSQLTSAHKWATTSYYSNHLVKSWVASTHLKDESGKRSCHNGFSGMEHDGTLWDNLCLWSDL